MIEKTFQTKLAKLRQDCNLSQKQLAEQIGVSQASINYWEKGQRTPSIDAAQKLANFFKIPISELLEPTTTKLFDDMTSLFSGSGTLQIDIKGCKINELFEMLNDNGQDKAIEQVELLTKIPEYRKDTEK
ncbi:MAG: helix-turn-helix transcriptional regulator [Agathobacter rectalis]